MPRSSRRLTLVAVILGLVTAGGAAPAIAQHHAQAPAAAAQLPDLSDADFLSQAAQANRFEIVTGRLAADRGRRHAVRRLGRMFERHHTAALAQGAAVAVKLGITPSPGLSPAQQAIADRLADLRGRSFDRAWLRAQLAAHQQSIALHLAGAFTGDTPDTRTLAITGLPVIGRHFGELSATARHH